jgi:ligand-binding sensor domain-containing protein
MTDLINKLSLNRRRTIIIAVVGILLLGAAIFFSVRHLNNRINSEREQQSATARAEVEESRLRAPSIDGLTAYLNTSEARAVVEFAGTRYLATSGGLIALDDGGSVKRRYTTLDGLTDNDLTALAVFRERLFIGTATAGLIGFDGNNFTSYAFVKPKAARVSVLLAAESELLIGTLDGGLFEYDGERFTNRFKSAPGADFSRITALLPFESRLYIGTQDRGLYIWREAHIEHLSTGEGLPSVHVTGLAALPSSFSGDGPIGVATDFGLVAINDANEIKPITARPNITSLAVSEGRLWAGLFSGGVIDIGADRKGQKPSSNESIARNESSSSLAQTAGLPRSQPAIVSAGAGHLWALTAEGAFAREEGAAGPGFESVASSLVGERMLTTGQVTSLAFDSAGRLWVGYFDRGIDVIAPDTSERLSHIEDERVREVNFITFDSDGDQVLAATSRGLIVFDGRAKQTVLTREKGGLINDSVAHVSLVNVASPLSETSGAMPVSDSRSRALVLATAGGLTEVLGGRPRSITAFHGLASNHLYTSAAVGSRLFVGSLAGLVEMEGLRVVRTYKTSNSRLSHDWVTALQQADGTLYVGTNGGGVDALLPTGEWVSFADEKGRFEVNQNAMHFDGERLYVGTSDRGLLVYNTRARRWEQISAGLTSQSVTAITTDDQFIYAGTSNGLTRIEKRVLK